MMYRIITILLLLFSASRAAEFDQSFIWHSSIHRPEADSDSFGGIHNSYEIIYLHSNIYRVEELNWNYLSYDFDRIAWGGGIEFSSIGYKQYYRRNGYKIYTKYRPWMNIRIMPALSICTERYLNVGYYTELTGSCYLSYAGEKYYVESGFAEIELKKPYPGKARDERIKPFVSGSWIFNDGLTLTAGIRRFDNHRTRWIFDQYIAVNKSLVLNFGYTNNPSNIYGGIDLTINHFSIIINYCSVGELSDSIIWGISFRK